MGCEPVSENSAGSWSGGIFFSGRFRRGAFRVLLGLVAIAMLDDVRLEWNDLRGVPFKRNGPVHIPEALFYGKARSCDGSKTFEGPMPMFIYGAVGYECRCLGDPVNVQFVIGVESMNFNLGNEPYAWSYADAWTVVAAERECRDVQVRVDEVVLLQKGK